MCVRAFFSLVFFSNIKIKQKGDQYELIRWPGTVAVLALLLVLCAVLLVGGKKFCLLFLFFLV